MKTKKGQVEWITLLILLLLLTLAILALVLFLVPFVVVAINIIALYILFIRIHTEIKKYRRERAYLLAFLAACCIMLIVGNFLPVWWFTTAVFLSFVLVHGYLLLEKKFNW